LFLTILTLLSSALFEVTPAALLVCLFGLTFGQPFARIFPELRSILEFPAFLQDLIRVCEFLLLICLSKVIQDSKLLRALVHAIMLILTKTTTMMCLR